MKLWPLKIWSNKHEAILEKVEKYSGLLQHLIWLVHTAQKEDASNTIYPQIMSQLHLLEGEFTQLEVMIREAKEKGFLDSEVGKQVRSWVGEKVHKVIGPTGYGIAWALATSNIWAAWIKFFPLESSSWLVGNLETQVWETLFMALISAIGVLLWMAHFDKIDASKENPMGYFRAVLRQLRPKVIGKRLVWYGVGTWAGVLSPKAIDMTFTIIKYLAIIWLWLTSIYIGNKFAWGNKK